MLFRRLRYFAAVVECGTFTEAAKRCKVSQSAVSQQVAALESSLGVTLLEREGRGFRLTPAGEHLYKKGFRLTPAGEHLYKNGTLLLQQADKLCAETVRLAD